MNQHKAMTGLVAGLCILSLTSLAACTSASLSGLTPTPEASAWGTVHTLAQAESAAAPAVAVTDATMFAWAGADVQEARIYAQSDVMESPRILALKVTTPLDVQIAPAGENFHLLWRDDVEGEPHLFYSLFNSLAVAELDAYNLSEQSVYHFALLPQPEGGLRVIYSAGWLAEPRLFLRDVDARGRAQFPIPLAQAGDFPTLLADEEAVWLFWQAEDGGVWQSRLVGTTLTDPHRIGLAPSLAAGDAIEHLTAAADATYRYLFWQIVRGDGTAETWYSVGEISGVIWSPAMRLTIPTVGETYRDTGYAVGAVTAAERGADPVGWSAPLTGRQPIVPIAVQIGDTLGIAYLQAGNIIGYQRLVTVSSMIGVPGLALRPDRTLVLAWSAPDAAAAALHWLSSSP